MKRRKSIIILAIFSLVFSQVSFVHAETENNANPLLPYKEELEKWNEEWGTNYKIQLEDGYTEQEMIEQYTSMSMEEFREYIEKIHTADITGIKTTNENRSSDDDKLRSLRYSQSAYYDGNNGFKVTSDIATSSKGVKTYERIISYGQFNDHYPYYDPSFGATFTFLNNKEVVMCVFKCSKYIASNLSDGVYYTITCRFNAASTRGAVM